MKDLAALLHPRSIAIVGCSPVESGKLGSWPLRNLLLQQTPVTLFPVNPGHEEMDGLTCYPDLAALPTAPDLVLVMVPAPGAVEVLRQAEAVGARAAIVFSAGFGETLDGGPLQEELRDFCRASTLAVCGPNTDGVINVRDRIPSGFPPYAGIPDLPTGPVAVVSQSGALVSSLVMRLLRNGLGLSYSFAVGNAVDLGIGDYLGHLATETVVETILVYAEGIPDRHGFLAGADRAIAAGKRIAILKSGRSPEGAAAAASHTGSMVGSYEAFQALCAAHGIVTADGLDELAALPVLLPVSRRIPGARSVGVVAGSGAVGGIITDQARAHGFEVPALAPETVARLAPRMQYGEPRNPVDLTGQVVHDPALHLDVLHALADDPGLDVIVASSLYGPAEITDRMKRELVTVSTAGAAVLVYATDGNEPVDEPILREGGVPVLPSLDVLFGGLRALTAEHHPVTPASDPARRERARALIEPLPAGPVPVTEAWALLALYDIPGATERPVGDTEEAVTLADEIGYPVALKLSGPSVPHRSDRGLVLLDLAGPNAVRAAGHTLAEIRDRETLTAQVVVQAMVEGEAEMIVGSTVDPEVGPVVIVGSGGIFTEVLADTALAPAPLDRSGAERLVARTRGRALLDGLRGRPALDRDALVDIVLAVSHLAADLEGLVSELDLNPVIVGELGASVVDVLVVRTPEGDARAVHR